MLAYLLLGMALLIVILLCARWIAQTDPAILAAVVKWVGGTLVGLLLIFLAVRGRLGTMLWVAGVALALIPVLRRMVAIGNMARSRMGPSGGQTSDIETDHLRMTLDHDSGAMSGTVLKGDHAGRALDDLGLDDLLALLAAFEAADPPSARLLETYLDRSRHDDWRDVREARAHRARGPARNGMTAEEAREILGVGPDASESDIREAHHRLMQRNHPDHGGSTYLAARINLAKEVLLRG